MTTLPEAPPFVPPPDTDTLIWRNGRPTLDCQAADVEQNMAVVGEYLDSKLKYQCYEEFADAVESATTQSELLLILKEIRFQRVVSDKPDSWLKADVYYRAQELKVRLKGVNFVWGDDTR